MAKTVRVVHPDFHDLVEEVQSDSVKDWTDAGWLKESELTAKEQKAVEETVSKQAARPAVTGG